MAGPSVGKISIDVEVFFEDKPIKCNVYIHVKGYSRALVTHLDIEGFDVYADKKYIPAVVVGKLDEVSIVLSNPITVSSMKVKKIRIKGLRILSAGDRSGAYLRIKEGGVSLGMRRELIKKLEEIARKKKPELFRDRSKSLDKFLR